MTDSNQHVVFIQSRRCGKTLAEKQRWIEETRRFQMIAHPNDEPESDEILGKAYDDMLDERRFRRLLNVEVGGRKPSVSVDKKGNIR